MDMDIVVAKEDVKTNVQLVKSGKPTPWLVGAAAVEIVADVAIAFCAFQLFKLLKH